MGKRYAACVVFFSINMGLQPIALAVKDMVQVIDEACAAQLYHGFFLGPELGEGFDGF